MFTFLSLYFKKKKIDYWFYIQYTTIDYNSISYYKWPGFFI